MKFPYVIIYSLNRSTNGLTGKTQGLALQYWFRGDEYDNHYAEIYFDNDENDNVDNLGGGDDGGGGALLFSWFYLVDDDYGLNQMEASTGTIVPYEDFVLEKLLVTRDSRNQLLDS